ncbi:retrotransposon protein, putative, ty1-copia subclass [Tanacetum coccineum]
MAWASPKMSYLKVLGCEALVKHDTLTKPEKLEPISIKCIFIGYPKETMGYSFYYPPENKVLVAQNVEFFENSLITQEARGSLEDLGIIQDEDMHPSENTSLHHDKYDQEIDEPQSDIIPVCRSIRTRHAPDRMCLYVDAEEHELGDFNEPANYKAALLDPEYDKWLVAINVELQSMKDNQVWDLVDLPPNGKTVGSKWLFKKKTDMDGNVHTYKARLVAKSFTQTYRKMDVKTAFLNGHLSEEVYMVQPKGFVNPKHPNQIKKFGFSQNRDEPCVYMKASGSNVTFLILYVDDILIMGTQIPMLQDLRKVSYVLGIKIYIDRSRQLIGLYQSTYIEKILKRFNKENSKREIIPMKDRPKLSKSQGASTPDEVKCMKRVPYASAIGYIMGTTLTTVKKILKYLRNTKDMFLVYEGDIKQELRVACYNDVGYLIDVEDSKYQTGYVFILNGGAIDSKSIEQSCDNHGLSRSWKRVKIKYRTMIIREVFVKLLLDSFGKLSIRVGVRTYLLGGSIDGSEANGFICYLKLELEIYRFTFDLVPLSCESVDVVVGENWLLRHKAEMVCHEKVVKMPWQEVWNDCRSCKVRVGSNGNLWWEAFVLLGRKKGGVRVAHKDDHGVTEGREDVREVFQQCGSEAKRKLSRCGKNRMGNELILALLGKREKVIACTSRQLKVLMRDCMTNVFDFEAKYHLGKANADVVPWSRKME